MIDRKLLDDARDSIIDGDKTLAGELAEAGLAAGADPAAFLEEGFIPGILEVGERFESGEVFLPEVMMAAEAMQEAAGILNRAMEERGIKRGASAKVVLATVESDLHDIGKGILASLMVANGFEVIDLGRDVPSETIVATAIAEGADFIGTSALLTTTMTRQAEIEALLKEKGMKGKIRTLVGGAPVTVRWQEKIGADGFGETAADGIRIVQELMEGGRS